MWFQFSPHNTKCGSALNSTIVSIYIVRLTSLSRALSSYSGRERKCCCLRIIGLRILCVHDIIYSIIISYHLPFFFSLSLSVSLSLGLRSVHLFVLLVFSFFLFQRRIVVDGVFFSFFFCSLRLFVSFCVNFVCEYVLSLACKFIRSLGWLTFVLGVVAHEANVLPLNSSKIYVSFTFVPIYGQITSSLCTCLHCLNKF